MMQPFGVHWTRYFRLPFVPLLSRVLPSASTAAYKASDWILQHWPSSERYASGVVTRLQK